MIERPILEIADVFDLIYTIDIPKERLLNSDAYSMWFFARYLNASGSDYKYLDGTGQLYLIEAFPNNKIFQYLVKQYPGFKKLVTEFWSSTMNRNHS